jgi:hypothetical protein
VPEEVAFFGRSGLFGMVLAAIYWFLSYELVGTFLLGGFGFATGLAFLVLRAGSRRAADPTGAPFEDEGGLVPLASLAPLELGFGIAVASLALPYGIWFVLAGLLPIVLGAADWLKSVMAETRAAGNPEG